MEKGKTPMSFNSVNTNRQAVFALQSLNLTNSELGGVQKRVSTGYRVSDARDDGGAFAVAQAVRSDIAGVTAVGEQLGGTRGILTTTFAALSVVSDTMKQMRAVLTRMADAGVTGSSRTQYEEQYKLLTTQVSDFIDDAEYNGRTLLAPVGTTASPVTVSDYDITSIRNETGEQFTIKAVDSKPMRLDPTAFDTGTENDRALLATNMIKTGGAFDLADSAISKALNQFGANMQFVENQMVYNSKKIDAMNDGLGALVDADLAKESSKLQALQTRQQLGVQTLGIANQGPQVLLSLFR
jgi:flagellin